MALWIGIDRSFNNKCVPVKKSDQRVFAMCGRAVSNLSCQICRCIYIVDIDERQERRSKTLKNNVN
jgi:hypothetical protein